MSFSKKLIKILVFSVLIIGLMTNCRKSVDELTKEVIASMEGEFKPKDIKIDSLVLTHKSDNEYTGFLETTEPNGNFKYEVEVIYDGKSFQWKVTEQLK